MAMPDLPACAWDAHVHCFDPENYPFKAARSYTPRPAKLNDLVAHVKTDRLMLVQASVEDGFDGLLATVRHCRGDYPTKMIRGTIAVEQTTGRGLDGVSEEAFKELHDAGVRSIRIHGSYGGSGGDVAWVKQQIITTAQLPPVRRYGWSISAQLPLSTWASLKTFLLECPDLQSVEIIADHVGCVTPLDLSTPAFADFLELLSSGRIYVKVSALHRRSPQNLNLMKPVIELLGLHGPDRLLWGSDWPHVDATKKGLEPSNPLQGVDTDLELKLLHCWLSEKQWIAMLVANPQRLFGP